MRIVLIAFLFLSAAHAGPWRDSLTPHFIVSHQMTWLPPGFAMFLEKLHSRLRLDLAMFAPDMARERVKLVIYEDQKSYLKGEYRPPPPPHLLSLFY